MILSLLGGLVVLVVGAELLVHGAASLARSWGISSLVVGLTVVSVGTSAPEAAVSIHASLNNLSEIAVGNILGSNIFNVLAILGVTALLRPLIVSNRLVRRDVPIMIGASVALIFLASDGLVSRAEGAALLAAMLAYLGLLLAPSGRDSGTGAGDRSGEATRDQPVGEAEPTGNPGDGGGLAVAGALLKVLLGLTGLILGSRWLVHGAEDLARAVGLSELVIGLTVVAVGTSLPEVAASVVAALRGERQMAVGNVVGSNIFNLLFVLGLASVVTADGVTVPAAARTFDIPVMTAVAVACLPIFFTDHMISRWEGAAFLMYFLAYTTFLFLDGTGHGAAPVFGGVMLVFVVPLTVVALLVVLVRELGVRAT